jgi:hypothetical protein
MIGLKQDQLVIIARALSFYIEDLAKNQDIEATLKAVKILTEVLHVIESEIE